MGIASQTMGEGLVVVIDALGAKGVSAEEYARSWEKLVTE
jgi:hypothetical protein